MKASRPPINSHPQRPLRVALVNMPWARVDWASIQCGLLKAELIREGHHAEVRYLNMDLAVSLGARRYEAIMSLRGERCHFVGEWLFGAAAFGTEPDTSEYLAQLRDMQHSGSLGMDAEELLDLRTRLLPEWIAHQAKTGDWSSFDIVGFSSTFEQNVASLALARDIKQASEHVKIVCGGANFDGEMGAEYMRAWPWIDYVVSGEGDIVFPQLVSAIASGGDPVSMPGVISRLPGGITEHGAAAQVNDMDALPVPDYTEYFEMLERHGRESVMGQAPPKILYESARGCWWGEKHHCTFCGLNRLTMKFRSKSPGLVVEELGELSGWTGLRDFFMVDNIMSMQYLSSVCAELQRRHWDLSLFYEVKANLSRDQLRALKYAGVLHVQPGIESLSSHVLELMRKGSTMLTNIRFLKWAAYYGMRTGWNILMGFPGESDADYLMQADLIPSLYHLEPPELSGRIWLERFSPYFTETTAGISNVRPRDAYRFIYPIEGIDLERIAYFFDYDVDGVAGAQAHARLTAELKTWRRRWQDGPPVLSYVRGPTWIEILDTRAKPRRVRIQGWRAAAYEWCGETARTPKRVAEFLAGEPGESPGEDQVARFLAKCADARLAATEDGRYLSLAIPLNSGW